jgi:predicted CXXCH cytochrome family protein
VQQEDQHEFTIEDPPSLCAECHEDLLGAINAADHLHDPAEEDCLDCHAPHGSAIEGMLNEEQIELCFDCHDKDEVLAEEYQHGPTAEGACSECHDPHSSSNGGLLRVAGAQLCGECHDDIVEEIQAAEFIHDPAEDDCIDCHHPHSGPYPKMLFAEKRQLCNECHDDVIEIAEGAKVDHACVLTGDECLTCHSPHAGKDAGNLKEPQVDLCISCHDKPVESNGVALLDVKMWLAEHPEWHEPIREGGCTECHQPHGGDNFRLLKGTFPSRFYSSFESERYSLCFSCHERAMVTREVTRKATGFRDGERNLHFLHVNKSRKGRTCRACHDAHASTNSFQIREVVPFGKWMMPINFEKRDRGGSCRSGCHRRLAYDRAKK